MPLNEIPKYIHPETRSLIESAVEQAWQELKSDNPPDVALARRKLAGTIVALTSVGETDPDKLKRFALHAARGLAQKRWEDGKGLRMRNEDGKGLRMRNNVH